MAETSVLSVGLEILSSAELDDSVCNLSIDLDSVTAYMKLHLDRNRYLQRSVYEFGVNGICYEPDYSSILLKVLQPGDTFIDVGANFGYFSLMASSLVTNTGKVFSFEPEKENFRFLSRNIALNDMTNIRAFNVATGNCNEEVELFIDPLNDGAHSLSGISPESRQVIGSGDVSTSRTQMVTLDSVLENEVISKIKIIKIDTEGWEFNTILGAVSIIKRYAPPIVLAEVNRGGLRNAGTSERYLRLLMAELGYLTYTAMCLTNGKLALEHIHSDYYAEPLLEHYNYNAVFARPQALNDYATAYHIFD